MLQSLLPLREPADASKFRLGFLENGCTPVMLALVSKVLMFLAFGSSLQKFLD
jgi:hypothetical protein